MENKITLEQIEEMCNKLWKEIFKEPQFLVFVYCPVANRIVKIEESARFHEEMKKAAKKYGE